MPPDRRGDTCAGADTGGRHLRVVDGSGECEALDDAPTSSGAFEARWQLRTDPAMNAFGWLVRERLTSLVAGGDTLEDAADVLYREVASQAEVVRALLEQRGLLTRASETST